jgi:uncharacterized protein
VADPLRLRCDDGVELEAECAAAEGRARAGMVLCHPHPQFGGTMRSIVIGALFAALPTAGVTCLRFNFRGVEGSGGTHGGGDEERIDAHAAVAHLRAALPTGLPLVLAGWSFGADVALSVHDEAVDAWYAIAPPLTIARDLDRIAADPRRKLFALAAHDEVQPAAVVLGRIASWRSTDAEVVPGASHFFMGRTDRVVALAAAFVDMLTVGRDTPLTPH